MILTQICSYWSLGAMNASSHICSSKNKCAKIHISFHHTWINAVITTLGAITYILLCYEYDELLFWLGSYEYKIGFIYQFLIYILSILSLAMFQYIDKCQQYCCTPFVSKCFPLRKITILDLENRHQLIYQDQVELEQRTNLTQSVNEVAARNTDSKFAYILQLFRKYWRQVLIALVFCLLIPMIVMFFALDIIFSSSRKCFYL